MKGKKCISILAALMLSVGVTASLTACGGECTHESVTKQTGYPATCYSTGIKDYYSCDNCNEWFLDEACTQSISGVLNALDIPMKEHVFADGELYCTNEGCYQEKPRTTELAGNTYLVLQNYVEYDMERVTPTQEEKIGEIRASQECSRYTGSKYQFETDGTVVSTELFVNVLGNGSTEVRVYHDTFVQEGNSFTKSRVLNAGTADEEVERETYTLDEYGYWRREVEIPSSLVAGYEGAKSIVVLEELSDHKLRHDEHSFPSGICNYCGEIETPLMNLAGTTWTFASVETFYYSDELAKNDTVDAFVQSFFENVIGTQYALNADGTVTSSLGGEATEWEQIGNYISISIYLGTDGEGQPITKWFGCKLSSDGIKTDYYFSDDWTWITDNNLVPAEYLQYFSAIICLTQS